MSKPMWPSLQTADWLFSASNIALIFGLALTALATIGAIWMANVREQYLKRELSKANERIASLQKDTVELGAKTAEANARAAEATLELARLKAPRTLNADQQARMVEKLKQYTGREYSFNVFPDPEPIALMRTIDNLLKTAGWVRIPSQVGDIVTEGAGHATDTGLQIGIKPTSDDEVRNLAVLLASIFTSEGIPAVAASIADLKNDKAININVGKKPMNEP